ncbi:MAG: gliding motility-associated C-terminal domain-containing protein [Bacteroidales bacterium]|nr:gliding motility-associated C-terminal domain-containing protein [Bacteroidales bacterium]
MNDVFVVAYEGSRIYNLQYRICDRWGGEVYSAKGIENGWDGKKSGKECPGGAYVYKIVFLLDGVPGNQERVGTVMLVR